MGAHARLGVVAAHAERHDAERRQLRVAVEDAGQGVLEHGAVVDARAHHHLAVHLDAVVEQRPQPAQARGAAAVAEHLGADVGIGGVDRHVERAEPLGDDPLEVGLGEPGEGGEVPVEEAQPVVVVLEVEALPQARRQLVDEAELAVVVAGAHLVEQRRLHLHPERLARPLVDLHGELEAPPPEVEHRVGVVDEEPPLDDVAGHLPVDGVDLVAHLHPGARGRRTGRDSDDSGSRHRTRLRPCRPGSLGWERMAVDRVLLAAPRGFCAGVEMAIKALAWMVRAFEPPVYCYHEIVHNQLVVDRFRDLGVVFVDDIAEVPPGRPIMLSAHGSAPEVVAAARASGGYVVDAVCPLVTKVHHEVKVRAGKGYQIVYVGHEGHEEAVGTMAVAPDSIHRVESVADVDALPDDGPARRAARPDHALPPRLGRRRRARPRSATPTCGGPGRSDLCFATTNRQSALGEIASRCDAVVVIGSANSSNTRALERLARESGAPAVYRINGPDELPDDLHGIVGVTAGASAPEELVERRDRPPRARRGRGGGAHHRRGRVLPSAPRAARPAHRRRRAGDLLAGRQRPRPARPARP